MLCLVHSNFCCGSGACFFQANGVSLSSQNVNIPADSKLSALNSHFTLSVTTTATNDAYPRSYVPLHFSATPTVDQTTQGLSIGRHAANANTVKGELRVFMGNGSKIAGGTLRFSEQSLGVATVYALSCIKTSKGRDCSVEVRAGGPQAYERCTQIKC